MVELLILEIFLVFGNKILKAGLEYFIVKNVTFERSIYTIDFYI